MKPSLYVHVPFCASRCSYCGFYSETEGDPERYLDALAAQLTLATERLGDQALPSVYIGGGTPSLLAPSQLVRLLALLAPWIGEDTECTLECNPEDLDEARLAVLVGGGVSRISLGLQSLCDEELARVGRRHDAAGGQRALALAVTSPLGVSVDLILGLPGQSEESFARSLDGVLAREPEHLSLYCLELEETAPLAEALSRRPDPAASERRLAGGYRLAHRRLADAGYRAYEVSNWCRPGKECRHNLGIWRGGEYLGFGPGAHSYWDGERWSWPASLELWEVPLMAGREPEPLPDLRDSEQRRLERLLLGLRIRDGIARDDSLLAGREAFLEELAARDWARCEEGRWRLEAEGWLRLDGILTRLAS